MTTTTDLDHWIGGDLAFSGSGDLAIAAQTYVGPQRVLRRLLTNPTAYPWHPAYGAGLPAKVGTLATPAQIRALVRQHVREEPAVARTPEPSIDVASIQSGVSIGIRFTDADTAEPRLLRFDVAR